MTTIDIPAVTPVETADFTDCSTNRTTSRAMALTAAVAVLLAALIVVDVTLLGMDAVAVFGSCLTVMLIAAGYAFRARFRG